MCDVKHSLMFFYIINTQAVTIIWAITCKMMETTHFISSRFCITNHLALDWEQKGVRIITKHQSIMQRTAQLSTAPRESLQVCQILQQRDQLLLTSGPYVCYQNSSASSDATRLLSLLKFKVKTPKHCSSQTGSACPATVSKLTSINTHTRTHS